MTRITEHEKHDRLSKRNSKGDTVQHVVAESAIRPNMLSFYRLVLTICPHNCNSSRQTSTDIQAVFHASRFHSPPSSCSART